MKLLGSSLKTQAILSARELGKRSLATQRDILKSARESTIMQETMSRSGLLEKQRFLLWRILWLLTLEFIQLRE